MLLGARQFFERRGAPTPPLPYDAEVEYLESVGNGSNSGQVINSSILIPSDCTHVEYHSKFAFTVNHKSVLCGNQTANYGNPRTYLFYTNGANTTRQFYCGNVVGGVTLDADEAFDWRVALDGQSQTLDVYKGSDLAFSKATSGEFLNHDVPIHFFGGVHGTKFDDFASMKIWYFKIVHGSTLVRDFIPVRFTNELGQSEGAMYDRVSGALFRNAGTGAFTIGPDKTSWTNPYVTDGLVAMWDGEWNAGGGVHDANAMSWKDLVGNLDFTLNTAATVNDNHIYCNGSQSAGDTGALIDVPVTTLEIVCQYLNSTANTAIFMTGGGSSYYREVFGIVLTNTQFVFANQTVSLKDTLLHSWSKNLGNVDCYRDGINIGINGSSTLDVNSNRGYIGRIGGTGNVGCECEIYCVRLYSRALTAAEIAANYAIDKARFNLP